MTARTEPDGWVTADGVLAGTYSPEVSCEGYRSKPSYPAVVVVAGRDVLDQVWEVLPGSTLRGKVMNASGAPIENAEVHAVRLAMTDVDPGNWSDDLSHPDGTYELRALQPATYKITVHSDLGIGPRDGVNVDVPEGATIEKDLILEAGGSVRGTVVDAQGAPVVDVGVRGSAVALGDTWAGRRDTTTDSTGSFILGPLRAGDYRVTACRGYGCNEFLMKPGTARTAKQGERTTVLAGQTSIVKLVVEAQTARIHGIVVGPDGAPVSDAFISSAHESGAGWQASNSAIQTRWEWGTKPLLTDTDGTFTVTNLAPGNYTLRAYRRGGGEAIAEHVATGTTARLQIRRTGSIEGIATRASGPPLDEITINLLDLANGFGRSETFFRTGGRFTVHDLPAGHFKLTATADGATRRLEVDLADGETRTGIIVTLEPLVTLTGRIIDHVTKEPIAGVIMSAQAAQGGSPGNSSSNERDNISGADGRFTIRHAPRGQLTILGDLVDPDAAYDWIRVLRTVDGTGTIDLGDIPAIKKRLQKDEVAGELGVRFVQMPNETPPDKFRFEVSFIEPGGPAAKTELKVGDVITSIDGIDISGGNWTQARPLMRAPVGTRLALGLARGVTVVVTLAAPT